MLDSTIRFIQNDVNLRQIIQKQLHITCLKTGGVSSSTHSRLRHKNNMSMSLNCEKVSGKLLIELIWRYCKSKKICDKYRCLYLISLKIKILRFIFKSSELKTSLFSYDYCSKGILSDWLIWAHACFRRCDV